MTVKELIEVLELLPPEFIVIVADEDSEEDLDIDEVESDIKNKLVVLNVS